MWCVCFKQYLCYLFSIIEWDVRYFILFYLYLYNSNIFHNTLCVDVIDPCEILLATVVAFIFKMTDSKTYFKIYFFSIISSMRTFRFIKSDFQSKLSYFANTSGLKPNKMYTHGKIHKTIRTNHSLCDLNWNHVGQIN